MRAVDFPQKSGRCVQKSGRLPAPAFFKIRAVFAAHLPSSLFPLHCSLFTLHFQLPPNFGFKSPARIDLFANNSRSKSERLFWRRRRDLNLLPGPLARPEPDLRRLCRLAGPLRRGFSRFRHWRRSNPTPPPVPGASGSNPLLVSKILQNNSRSKNPSGGWRRRGRILNPRAGFPTYALEGALLHLWRSTQEVEEAPLLRA